MKTSKKTLHIERLENRIALDGSAELVKAYSDIPSFETHHRGLGLVNHGVHALVATDDYLVFLIRQAEEVELWRTDGTSEGTIQILDELATGALTAFKGRAYFSKSNGSKSLWQTDGTESGTVRVESPQAEKFADVTILTTTIDHIFFMATTNDTFGVWVSDGTWDGSRLIYESETLSTDTPVEAISYEGGIYFAIPAENAATEVFQFDTAQQSVVPFASLPPTRTILPGYSSFHFALATNRNLVVGGFGDSSYWTSDGTEAGTFSLGKVSSISTAQINDVAVLMHSGECEGPETCMVIWSTNGTSDRTQDIAQLSISPFSVFEFVPNVLAAVEDYAFFSTSTELWRTDGTPQGTELVSDAVRPFGNHNLTFAVALRESLYFMGYEPETGYELWRSKGTEESTVRLTDIAPGEVSSYPKFMTEFDGYIYFRTDVEGQTQSLYRIAVAPIPGDANADGAVDFADFIVLSANFGRDDDVSFSTGDFDGNGQIDFTDFVILSNNFGARTAST